MPDSQDAELRARDAGTLTHEASAESSRETAASGSYHPSRAFRMALRRARRGRPAASPDPREAPKPHGVVGRAPDWPAVISAAIAVGALSGLLELAVLRLQVDGFRIVDWSTLMISHHADWMIPATGAAVVVCLAIVLAAPVLAVSAWRRRRLPAGAGPGPAWDCVGAILGVLLLLGPLLAVRGFHPAAPIAMALGLGFRIRRLIVWPTATWRRRAHGAAAVAIGVLVVLLLVRGPAGAWPARIATAGPAVEAPNLLWIVLDTLRADRMSVYGYPRRTTPELEAWARLGITFDMARSAAPWTLPSHVTMFTGLWPSEHGACVDRPYSGDSPTLAEHLRSRGYATAGIVANVRMCNAAYGVGRGFDHYVDYPWRDEISLRAALNNSALGAGLAECARRLMLPAPSVYPFAYRQAAPVIAREARRWLDGVASRPEAGRSRAGRPFFLFVNFMDVHGPYLPPADVPRRFWDGPAPTKHDARPEDGWRALHARDTADPAHRPGLDRELAAVGRRLGDLYDECLAGLDARLGQFLEQLRDRGRLADTWVVITADHGEHFGEHDLFGHGTSLYNEQTHVPLILIPPLGNDRAGTDPYGDLRGRRIDVPVSLRDLPATMSGLLLPGATAPFPGRSLARHWRGDRPQPADPVLAELDEPRLKGEDFRTQDIKRIESIVAGEHVLIQSSHAPAELFALFKDPRQEHNLADRPESAVLQRRLSTLLHELHHRQDGDSAAD